MKFYTAEEFIQKHLRHGQHWNKKLIRSSDAITQELTEHTHIGGINYAAGSKFKVFETSNFGWIVFQQNTITPNGQTPGRLIHKW